MLIHHYRKPSLEDIGDPIYRVTGSAGFANFCETFIGLDRTHKKRSSNFKTIHFLLRREENPSDIYLHRNPDTLIYGVVSREEAISSGIKVRDLIRVFKEDLEGEKISYSLLIDIITDRLGIKKTRVKELIKEAQDEGLIIKEEGRFGKYKLNMDAELDLYFS